MIFGRSGVSVYIMTSKQHPGKYKIGISNKPTLRSKQVSESIKGSAKVFFKIEVWFAYYVEQLLHFLFAPINTKMKGSGKTEWFKPGFPLWLIAGVVIVAAYMKPAAVAVADYATGCAVGLFALYLAVEIVFVLFVVCALLMVRALQEIAIMVILYFVITRVFSEVEK